MIVVTGATGQLGRLVIEQLLQKVPAAQVVAAVRSPEKARALAAQGVQVREADYDRPGTLEAAFRGAEKLLLISSNEMGKRVQQHQAAIDAAKRAGVKLVVYTSILKADTSGISLAAEHLATEKALRASGLPFVLLRNSWYFENYTENLAPALQHGALLGAAKEGRIAAATRADYAAAAVAVLTTPGHEGQVYELAGDQAFTLRELAEEVSRQAKKPVAYNDMPAEQYAGVLQSVGLPAPVAQMLASADQGIARGELDDRSGTLRRLIGRPTTPLAKAVSAALP
ncbi:SDR family oxidoreductase [Aggregicoccus sp. 17bor-14]|uniref:SDR family oxidoreductase n=1 Tax=Myxococcaceae TaxID=31 RepID=UPI00129CEC9C|nr:MULTISPECIES: SDR family oxidoreductase [Myxococcaceae]MBF5045312.1 SDR family oxidoreductase [Simulacricoccus sp. 17bor-14]MRI91054.1 SDR family oxidoreductase [Aggregicoccus sp. 17bor-14]